MSKSKEQEAREPSVAIKKPNYFKLFLKYIILNKSQRVLAKELQISRTTLRFYLSKYGIHKDNEKAKQTAKHTFFQKGHQINLGRARPDMIDRKNWEHPNNPFKKGHLLNLTSGISLYRRLVHRKQCQKCGKEAKIISAEKLKHINLDVHHIDKNRNNNHINNLFVLCRGCHNRVHNGSL